MNENKAKIIIVDDEKGIRIGTQRLLQNSGFEVDVAENGTTGIALGLQNDYDIAIIDLKMPDIDGLEVLKRIKEVRKNTICFIATAYASYDTAIQATRLGAFGYIPKPFTQDELLYQIENGLKQRQLLLEAEKLRQEREEKLLELANEKSRLNVVINSLVSGVLVVNKSGEIVYYNNAVLKNLNIDELVIGESILTKSGIPDTVINNVKKFLDATEFLDKMYSSQVAIKPDNQLFVEIICSAIPHLDGSLAGVAIIIRDITEMKKIEMIKSQFVSMVAHELKTPVAAVLGFIRILLDETMQTTKEQHDEYLSRSAVRLKGLLDLVNDLLDISRMEMKTKEKEIQNIDVKEIISSTIQFLEIDIKKKGVVVETNIPDNLPSFKADNGEITRVFTNILSNAIKYNKDNGKIFIDVEQHKNFIKCKIKDTGIGLKPEEKKKLFSEFYRAKNEKTRNIAGTGLGLNIVKRIVESYNGKIEFDSEYGVGTEFIIYFPV